jgi:hypothetical protein
MVIKGHNTTPASSKHGEGKPRVTRTIGDKELEAKRLHFETCLLQQDLVKKAEEIHTVMSGDDERAKKKLPKTMSELLCTLRVISERLEKFNLLMQQSRECKDYIWTLRSQTNKAIKISQKDVPVEKRKSPEDFRIGQLLQDIGPTKKKHKKSPPSAASPPGVHRVDEFTKETPPGNKSHYTYHELVQAICADQKSKIYRMSVRQVHDELQKKSLVLFSRASLQRYCTDFSTKGSLPRLSADGSTNGRPSLIEKENIPLLNQSIFRHIGSTSVIELMLIVYDSFHNERKL